MPAVATAQEPRVPEQTTLALVLELAPRRQERERVEQRRSAASKSPAELIAQLDFLDVATRQRAWDVAVEAATKREQRRTDPDLPACMSHNWRGRLREWVKWRALQVAVGAAYCAGVLSIDEAACELDIDLSKMVGRDFRTLREAQELIGARLVEAAKNQVPQRPDERVVELAPEYWGEM